MQFYYRSVRNGPSRADLHLQTMKEMQADIHHRTITGVARTRLTLIPRRYEHNPSSRVMALSLYHSCFWPCGFERGHGSLGSRKSFKQDSRLHVTGIKPARGYVFVSNCPPTFWAVCLTGVPNSYIRRKIVLRSANHSYRFYSTRAGQTHSPATVGSQPQSAYR